jgi:hypothetical protein
MNTEKNNAIMCLKCEGKNFTAKPISIGFISMPSIAWVCDNCDEALMDTEQMDECRKNIK